MIYIKRVLLFFIIVTTFSCKQKMSKEEQLQYYVMVILQTREMPKLISDFNTELINAKKTTIKDYKNIQHKGLVDSLRTTLISLLIELDRRIKVLDNIPEIKGNLKLRTFAQQYLVDTRKFIAVQMPPLINSLNSQPKEINEAAEFEKFKNGKALLAKEGSGYYAMQKLFKQVHHLDQKDLEKYGL